eukprot:6490434-Amphidinium_carterae.8
MQNLAANCLAIVLARGPKTSCKTVWVSVACCSQFLGHVDFGLSYGCHLPVIIDLDSECQDALAARLAPSSTVWSRKLSLKLLRQKDIPKSVR